MLMALYIAGGGALGALARHGLNVLLVNYGGVFPLSTFVVNILGAFVLAFFVEFFALVQNVSENTRAFLVVGFLGAFTTFSTFSMESILLIQKGKLGLACAYIGGSVLCGLLAFIIGLWTVKYLFTQIG